MSRFKNREKKCKRRTMTKAAIESFHSSGFLTSQINSSSLPTGSSGPVKPEFIGWRFSSEPSRYYPISEQIANKALVYQWRKKELQSLAHVRKAELALSRLEEFETLEDDWDSYGATPIDRSSIEEARDVLRTIERMEFLSSAEELDFYPIPSTSGGMSLYFEFESRELRLKLQPQRSKSVVYRVDKSNSEAYKYWRSEYERAGLLRLLLWLVLGDNLHQGANTWSPYQIRTTFISEYAIFTSTDEVISKTKHSSHENLITVGKMTTAERKVWTGADIAHQRRPLPELIILNANDVTHSAWVVSGK